MAGEALAPLDTAATEMEGISMTRKITTARSGDIASSATIYAGHHQARIVRPNQTTATGKLRRLNVELSRKEHREWGWATSRKKFFRLEPEIAA
jgi:hypothetical protein